MNSQIDISVDHKHYATYLYKGVQRFPPNKLILYLFKKYQIDLNDLKMMADIETFSQDEYMQFYMDIGYSVCGLLELFPEVEIENPLWDKEKCRKTVF